MFKSTSSRGRARVARALALVAPAVLLVKITTTTTPTPAVQFVRGVAAAPADDATEWYERLPAAYTTWWYEQLTDNRREKDCGRKAKYAKPHDTGISLAAFTAAVEHLLVLFDAMNEGVLVESAAAEAEAGDGVMAADRAARARKAGLEDVDAGFICPISQDLMQNAVVAADGHSYDRQNIQRWISQKSGGNRKSAVLSPMTSEPLKHHDLTPNHTLRAVIKEYTERKARERREARAQAQAEAQTQVARSDAAETVADGDAAPAPALAVPSPGSGSTAESDADSEKDVSVTGSQVQEPNSMYSKLGVDRDAFRDALWEHCIASLKMTGSRSERKAEVDEGEEEIDGEDIEDNACLDWFHGRLDLSGGKLTADAAHFMAGSSAEEAVASDANSVRKIAVSVSLLRGSTSNAKARRHQQVTAPVASEMRSRFGRGSLAEAIADIRVPFLTTLYAGLGSGTPSALESGTPESSRLELSLSDLNNAGGQMRNWIAFQGRSSKQKSALESPHSRFRCTRLSVLVRQQVDHYDNSTKITPREDAERDFEGFYSLTL